MTSALVLMGLLASAPAGSAAAPANVKLAAPGLTVVKMDPALGSFYTEHLAQQFALVHVRLVTAKEMSALLGFEKQRQLLGCSNESSSCAAELANALGVDGLLIGEIGHVGRVYQLNLRVMAATNGQPLASYSASVDTEERVLSALSTGASVMAEQVWHALGRQAGPTDVETSRSGGRQVGPAVWISGGAGIAVVAGSAVALAEATSIHNALAAGGGGLANPASSRDQGKVFQTSGDIGLAVGVASLGLAGALYLLGGPATGTLEPTAMVAPGGAFIGVSGEWP